MGWISISKTGEVLREETHGRPVAAGEEGSLAVIAQEDFGHKVAIDLHNGIIALDYETLGWQNGTPEISGVKSFLYICDDTNIGADLFHLNRSEPDAQGWYSDNPTPLTWRPIWFTRTTAGVPAKIIGAQTTLPPEFGSHNVKTQIILFSDGRVGIYVD